MNLQDIIEALAEAEQHRYARESKDYQDAQGTPLALWMKKPEPPRTAQQIAADIQPKYWSMRGVLTHAKRNWKR